VGRWIEERQVTLFDVLKARCKVEDAGFLLHWQADDATCSVRSIETRPNVFDKGEGFGLGISADVDGGGDIACVERDEVAFDVDVAATCEAWMGIFLKDAKGPALRQIDCVVMHCGAVDSDKGDGGASLLEDAVFDRDVLGFIGGVFGAEVVEAGAASAVDAASAVVCKETAANEDLFRASFGLHSIGDVGTRIGEDAVLDDAAMATNHIDAGAGGAPGFDAAVFDHEIVDA